MITHERLRAIAQRMVASGVHGVGAQLLADTAADIGRWILQRLDADGWFPMNVAPTLHGNYNNGRQVRIMLLRSAENDPARETELEWLEPSEWPAFQTGRWSHWRPLPEAPK